MSPMFDLYSMTSQCTSRCCRFNYKRKNWSWARGTNYQYSLMKGLIDKRKKVKTEINQHRPFVTSLRPLKSRAVNYEVIPFLVFFFIFLYKITTHRILTHRLLFPPLATTFHKPSSLLPNCIWFGHNVYIKCTIRGVHQTRTQKLSIHAHTHSYEACTRTPIRV